MIASISIQISIQKTSHLFKSHQRNKDYIFVQTRRNSIERELLFKSFLIDAYLISQKRSFSLCSLIDSDSVVYTIIHFNLVDKVCKKLKIQSISLTKEKLIRDYDEKIFKKTITHKILFNLIIESHKKLTVSMLIADIDHHEVILSKL